MLVWLNRLGFKVLVLYTLTPLFNLIHGHAFTEERVYAYRFLFVDLERRVVSRLREDVWRDRICCLMILASMSL
jgi:hypothetical protein